MARGVSEIYNHVALKPANVPLAPQDINIDSFWGQLLRKSCENWALKVSDDLLLSGFRKKPGIQAYIGEHIGKYLLSAIPTSILLNSQPLKDKVKFLVENLVALQEPDGYLGTYLPDKRWYGVMDDKGHGGPIDLNGDEWGGADVFDVWVHKYCILALLTYYQYYDWEPALKSAIKAADLIIHIFGPGGRNINNSDYPAGLGSGSFMEPLMLLNQITGIQRYLDFAHYILAGWEDPTGPRVLTVLNGLGDVVTIGDGKAYEMMSCFVGLVEYARATGDKSMLQLVIRARDQIADSHRYVTGGMSNLEYFWRSGLFPEWTNMETCVTFTWIQLNLRLYELVGDPRSLDLAEESAWNQLLPAISPKGDTWSYFMSLVGPKRFFGKWLAGVAGDNLLVQGAPVTCCHTNGQRGLALVPSYAYTTQPDDVLAVNFYGSFHATAPMRNGEQIQVEQITDFPASDDITLRFTPMTDNPYQVNLRVPIWAEEMHINQQPVPLGQPNFDLKLQGKQTLQIHFKLTPRVILSGFEGRGKCSIAYGPLVYALDKPLEGINLDSVILNLGHGDYQSRLNVEFQDGWPVIRVPACQIPSLAAFEPVFQPIGNVDLIPVLLAGLKGNPGLEETLDGESMPFFNQEKIPITYFPEYRVLLPFFWSPE